MSTTTATLITATTDLTEFLNTPVRVTRDAAACGGHRGDTHNIYGEFVELDHHTNTAPCFMVGAGGTLITADRGRTSLYVPYGSTIEVLT